ncbi:MAG: HEPN domain-containing protein [Planctomycetota bacterium]|nr:HEPN domain-containing protein [Planctomycetota bacterium]
MSDGENARRLLALAAKDLQALEGMLDTKAFATEIFGFHAQQAVEKALKAWLSFAGVACPRTHDLGVLFSSLSQSAQPVPPDFHALEQLTDFAVQFRYEAFDTLGEDLDRADILRRVTEFVTHVGKLGSGP